MDSSMDLNDFLILPPRPPESAQPGVPDFDLQRLQISPQRARSRSSASSQATGMVGDSQEPNSGGGNSSTGSATISETKKIGKFRFLTIPNVTDESSPCQANSDSNAGGSPYLQEASSAESCDESHHGPSSGVPRSRKSAFNIDATVAVAGSSAGRMAVIPLDNQIFDIPGALPAGGASSAVERPRDRDEDLINKHVKRLLKVTEITDNIGETEEDFDAEDDDFDSRLDQMIAEEEQSRKKGRRRPPSKTNMGRRRSTRNSRKDEVPVSQEIEAVLPVVSEKIADNQADLPPQPKKRGRKKKVVVPPPPSEKSTDEPMEREPSLTGKDTSDDATSQMSELKADSEDLTDPRPGKLKSRWVEQATSVSAEETEIVLDKEKDERPSPLAETQKSPSPTAIASDSTEGTYEVITDCIRLSRHKIRDDREARKMRCECQFTAEDAEYGVKGCTPESCLNRMLYIECGPKCPAKDYCSNKRFQKREYASLEIFKTKLKGHGIKAKQALTTGQFISEYVGEVLDAKLFKKRQKEYQQENIQHHYFMALNNEEVIDATRKGNCTRFTNHSCDPNSETQKWTVAGQLRIGFFTLRPVAAGEEITFDYQFERYGKKAQRCYCGSSLCRGFIGSVSSDDRKKSTKGDISDRKMVSEIEKFVQLGAIRTADQALRMARLLLRVEEDNDRLTLLRVLHNSEDNWEALKAFLRCQGLTIMADLMYVCRNSSSEMKLEILQTLPILPLVSRNPLVDSKIWEALERWAGQTVGKNIGRTAVLPTDSGETVKSESTLTESKVEPSGSLKLPDPDLAVDSPPVESIDVDQLERQVLDIVSFKDDNFVRKDTDEDSQDTLEEQPPPANADDDDVIKRMAGQLLQKWSDTLKMSFKIPKKLIQDRDLPPTSEESRKSPVKTTPGGASGITIPTVAPGWCRTRRSTSPTSQVQEAHFFRPKQPRFTYPRHERPFQFFARRPIGPGVFPHRYPPFSHGHQPPFPDLVPMETVDIIGEPSVNLPEMPVDQVAAAALSEVAAVEQARLNAEIASEQVSQCLLNNSISNSRKVSLVLSDGSVHDVRTFKPSAQQIELIKRDLPVIESQDWEEKAEMIRTRSGLEVKAMDAPITQEVVGWMANFDLSKHVFLPKDWCAAYDRVGRMYFYNISNGVSRWDFPVEEHVYSTVLQQLSSNVSIPADLKDHTMVPAADLHVRAWSPLGDDGDDDSPRENTVPSKSSSEASKQQLRAKVDKRRTKISWEKSEKSEARMKKRKIDFQNDVCQYVLLVLNAYRSAQCTQARIQSKEDFKYLARKFTHNVLEQEMKRHRDNPDALKFSSKHKPKIKEHVKKYMSRFGKIYKPLGGSETTCVNEEDLSKSLMNEEEDGEEIDRKDEEDLDLLRKQDMQAIPDEEESEMDDVGQVAESRLTDLSDLAPVASLVDARHTSQSESPAAPLHIHN